jgi:hypothetical protein
VALAWEWLETEGHRTSAAQRLAIANTLRDLDGLLFELDGQTKYLTYSTLPASSWQVCEIHGLKHNTRFGCWRCNAPNQESKS